MENKNLNQASLIKYRISKASIFSIKQKVSSYYNNDYMKSEKIKIKDINKDKEEASSKLNSFINKYSTEKIKIFKLPTNKLLKINKNKKEITAFVKFQEKVKNLIGEENRFSDLVYRNSNNTVYATNYKRVSLRKPSLFFYCKSKKCRGYIKYNYKKGTIEEIRPHDLNYEAHHKFKYYQEKILFSELTNNTIACLGIISKKETIEKILYPPEVLKEQPIINNDKEIRVYPSEITQIFNKNKLKLKLIFDKYLGERKMLSNHYKKDDKGNIFGFSFQKFIVSTGLFLFRCSSQRGNCPCKGFYNIFTKDFTIKGNHIKVCLDNIKHRRKLEIPKEIFGKNKNLTDIQIILTYKN